MQKSDYIHVLIWDKSHQFMDRVRLPIIESFERRQNPYAAVKGLPAALELKLSVFSLARKVQLPRSCQSDV